MPGKRKDRYDGDQQEAEPQDPNEASSYRGLIQSKARKMAGALWTPLSVYWILNLGK